MPKPSISKYFSKKLQPPDSQPFEKPPIAISSPQIGSLSNFEITEVYAGRQTATSSEDSDKDINNHLKKIKANYIDSRKPE